MPTLVEWPGSDITTSQKLILRRFAIREGDEAGLIWRASVDGTSIRTVAPKFEAARAHYYALPPELNLPSGFAEDTLMAIESLTGAAIARFDRDRDLTLDERHALALFLVLQHRRTPTGRRELKFMDEFMARMYAEMQLSDTNVVKRVLMHDGGTVTEEEVAAWQQARLEELRSGELIIESTPEREVGLMFSNLDTIVPKIVLEFDWRFLLIPEDGPQLVLPDVGLTVYDPEPPFPEAGTGFASSRSSETVLYLDSQFVLMIRPGPGFGDIRHASSEVVETMNRRAIACSDRCIYGPSREAVDAALSLAEHEPKRIEALRPRPPVFWIGEGHGEPQAGPMQFVGHSRTGTTTRELHVSQEGIDEARRNALLVGE